MEIINITGNNSLRTAWRVKDLGVGWLLIFEAQSKCSKMSMNSGNNGRPSRGTCYFIVVVEVYASTVIVNGIQNHMFSNCSAELVLRVVTDRY